MGANSLADLRQAFGFNNLQSLPIRAQTIPTRKKAEAL
jgi:hypothetical protein